MSDYIWIEGNQAHTSGDNGSITRVVIHATVSPCEVGGARSVARYFQSPNAGGLAHYVVDPSETVQCCKETISSWHAPPNKGSLGVELCDPQQGAAERWYDAPHRAMLQRAAVLVADLCKRHSIPAVLLSPADLLAGKHGVTSHANVSQAFHQSSHTDPGVSFPMAHFLDLVHKAMTPVAAHAAVKPTPVQPRQEQRMIVRFESKPDVYEVVGSHLEHITAEAFRARDLTAKDILVVPDTDPLGKLPRS